VDELGDDTESEDPGEPSDVEDPVSELLGRYYEQMVRIIDGLYHVSMLIRGLSHNIRVARASGHVEIQNGEDVLAAFRNQVELKIKWKNPGTPQWLIQRLTDDITLRRRQFYYHRAHKERLSGMPAIDALAVSTVQVETVSVTDKPRAPDSLDPRDPIASRTKTRTITTGTVATTATDLAPVEELASTPINIAPSEMRIGVNIFPEPPKDPAGKAFECTQCFHVLPAETRRADLWR